MNSEDYIKSTILTFVQYLLLFLLLWLNPWFSKNLFLLIIQIFGIGIGFWAIFDMSRSKLNITPLPRDNAVLISSGLYRLIRHPMYLGLIFFFTPMIISNPDTISIAFYSTFLINLLLKLLFEENVLTRRLAGYSDYKTKTWRLIPFVF